MLNTNCIQKAEFDLLILLFDFLLTSRTSLMKDWEN